MEIKAHYSIYRALARKVHMGPGWDEGCAMGPGSSETCKNKITCTGGFYFLIDKRSVYIQSTNSKAFIGFIHP